MEDVLKLLPADGKPVRWQELLTKAKSIGMSSATLSKHLKQLVHAGMIARGVDSRSYPPRVLYHRIPHPIPAMDSSFPTDRMDSVWLTLETMPAISRVLSTLSNRIQAETYLDRILKYDLSRLAAYLAWAIREVLSEKDIKDADQRMTIIIGTYIASWIRGLTEVCYNNKDISTRVLSRSAAAILDTTNDKLDDLITTDVIRVMQERTFGIDARAGSGRKRFA